MTEASTDEYGETSYDDGGYSDEEYYPDDGEY